MNLLISKKKFNSILLMLIILLCQVFIGLYGIKSNIDIDNILIMVSWATFIGFICEVLLWKYLTDELFCPYIVFICVLFIFCCGQSIGWTLGIDLGGQDLWFRHDYGMDHHWLIIALVYSTLGITLFHFGITNFIH